MFAFALATREMREQRGYGSDLFVSTLMFRSIENHYRPSEIVLIYNCLPLYCPRSCSRYRNSLCAEVNLLGPMSSPP